MARTESSPTSLKFIVNLQSAYPNELAKQVKDGDEIHVTMMLAGG